MIIFFYGEDTFRMRLKLRALKEKFISASLGDTNLAVLDGEKLTYDELVRQILAMPFLAKSRLVIIEGVLKKGKKEVLEKIPEVLAKIPKSTVLVFAEEGPPDKRTTLYKKLVREKSEEFKLLDEAQLRRWVIRELEMRNGKPEPDAVLKLIEYVGNDLWRMTNELDKLVTHNKKLTVEDVELLVSPQTQSNVFDLIDNLGRKNLSAATKELYKLLNDGANELYILTMIIWQYRNLLIVKDLSERTKQTNTYALAKKAGISPFVVQKSLSILPRYSLDGLKQIYAKLLDFDTRTKTGKIEPRTALELLVFALAKA